MDAEDFDGLARVLTGAQSRRQALAAIVGSVGLLGLVGHDEASAGPGKCKPACFDCATCKKGTCKKVNGKLHCTKSKCKPKPDETPCAGGTCQGGTCVGPFPSPQPFCAGKNFCPIATLPPTCQASGAQCLCAVKDDGSPACVLETLRFENNCGACTGPGEICLDATGCVGQTKACATPCPAPLV